ncbi:hypothetical protein ENBRE01_2432 [Enteropsectra breve]|nr:hypothetical protein ENBRE01_2432 [Enteropsectra breve]
MRDASYLSQHNYLSVAAITDQIIIRSLPELRTILWQVAGNLNNVYELTQAVEAILPLAYSSEGSMSNVSSEINMAKRVGNPDKDTMKWCALHGRTYHDMDSCITLKHLRQKNTANKNEKTSFKHNIKNDSDYVFKTCFSLNNSKDINPFVTQIEIFNSRHKCIIDTGADTSFIPQQYTVRHKSVRM